MKLDEDIIISTFYDNYLVAHHVYKPAMVLRASDENGLKR